MEGYKREHIQELGIPQLDDKMRREKYLRILEDLSGYHKLTEKQRQYIRVSLAIQERAERGGDPGSESYIQDMPDFAAPFAPKGVYMGLTEVPKGKSLYSQSQVHVMLNRCHDATAKVEELNPNTREGTTDWFSVGPTHTFKDLEELILLAGESGIVPPAILRISRLENQGKDTEHATLAHSTVLLGEKDGEPIVWEKTGLNTPYRLARLRDVWQVYQSATRWEIRSISV